MVNKLMLIEEKEFTNIKNFYNDKKQLHREDGPAYEGPNGSKEYWFNGKLHRINGPAIEWSNGTKVWYINGKMHRIGGPAKEYPNKTKYWYTNGVLHRLDGPACESKLYIDDFMIKSFSVSNIINIIQIYKNYFDENLNAR